MTYFFGIALRQADPDFLQFSVSFSPFVNSTPYRYVYPACDPADRHLSSLIQVVKFSERPSIVPHEIQNGLNAGTRALSLINCMLLYVKRQLHFPSEDNQDSPLIGCLR